MADSQINPAVFPDNVKVDKADLREQFQIAKDEITALNQVASPIRSMAYSDVRFDTL